MKIRILRKNKFLRESITTDRYKQTQTRATGEITHAPQEVQESRIEIGVNIDRFLQRPYLTVGEEMMDDDGEVRKITNPKETNLLLYVYRGVTPDGKLQNNQNIAAVNRELNERVGHFLMSLNSYDKKVLASDVDFIIQNMLDERSADQEQTHQSTHMLKNAPGHFDDYVFATRRRSVYKDTRAGKDFMLKRTPELKNIPEQHHFLFSMENLMGRVKQALGEQPDSEIPPLDPVSYDANYRLGDLTEEIEKERNQEVSVADRSYAKMVRNFFILTYGNPHDPILQMPPEKQLELMGPYLEMLLIRTKQSLDAWEKPVEFFEFLDIVDNVPEIFFVKYAEVFESFIMGIEKQGHTR